MSQIVEFQSITGCDEQAAKRFLQNANYNLELALSNYFDQNQEPPQVREEQK